MSFRIEYEALLSGWDIPLSGVGTLRQLKLKDICSSDGIGNISYNTFLFMMRADNSDLIRFVNENNESKLMPEITPPSIEEDLVEYFSKNPIMCKLCEQSFDCFFIESVKWANEFGCFICYSEEGSPVGIINKDNFNDVRGAILRMNYVAQKKQLKDIKFVDEKTEALFKRIAEHEAAMKKRKNSDPSTELGNIISKLCTISHSYNVFNVYDLTVFQLYDQFAQASYMRSIEFSEAIVSNHGSDKFKYADWLKPVDKN